MKRGHLTQTGSLHLALILGVVVVAVTGLVGWRVMSAEDEKSTNSTSQQSASNANQNAAEESDIVLQNFGLTTLDSVDINPYAVREFNSQGLKGFYAFGEPLSGGRLNPTFEFASLKSGTKVVAAIDGIVAFIKEQPETKDYEVFLQPKENSKWTVGYDHLVNVSVTKGATIKAGTVLGEPAVQNNGLTRFEIQINKDEGGKTTHVCPSTLINTETNGVLLKSLANMMSDWETKTGLDLYAVSETDLAGCFGATTLTPEQAEGR
jgi:hypothetical protein